MDENVTIISKFVFFVKHILYNSFYMDSIVWEIRELDFKSRGSDTSDVPIRLGAIEVGGDHLKVLHHVEL